MTATSLSNGDGGRRLWGRLGVVVLWMSGIAMVLAALALAGLAVLIAHGPVEIETATGAVERVLADLAGVDGRSHIGAARIDWSWAEGLSVDVTDVTFDRGDGLVLSVPRAEIRLALLPILVGEARPRALIFVDPRLTVDLVALTATAATPPATPAAAALPSSAPPAAALADPAAPTIAAADAVGRTLERAVAALRAQGLESVGLRNGTIEIVRRTAEGIGHVFVEAIDVDGLVDGPVGELDAVFSARGGVGRWSMRLTKSRPDADGVRALTFAADDVTWHDLFGPGGPAFEFGMPLYPKVVLHHLGDGRLRDAEIELRLGAGEFRFGPEPSDRILLDEAQARVVWHPEQRRFAVESLGYAVGETTMALSGAVTPPATVGAPWVIALTADRGAFRPRDVGGEAVPVDGGSLRATFDPATRFFDVAEARIGFGGASLRTTGRLDFSGTDPRLRLDLVFSPLTTPQIAHVWPHWVAPEARDWFIRSVRAGRVSDFAIRLDMPRLDHPETWPADAFQMAGRFDGFRFDPLGNLPAITGAEGRLSVADRRFEAVFDRAQAATRAPKRPTIDGFRFQVPDIFVKPPKGSLRFQIAGEVAALAEIVDAEPLAILEQAGIRADGLTGTAAVAAQIDMVFEQKIDMAAIEYRIDATLDRFGNTNPIQGRRFQDGKFRILADSKGLKITGRSLTDGVVADIDVFEPRGGSKLPEKRDFKMVLDDAARSRLGLDLGGMVQGAIGLVVGQPNQTEPRRHVDADLTAARLVLAPFGWTKGSGVPGRAVFDWVDDDKGGRIENLVVESEGFAVRGAIQIDKDRKFQSADLSKFALRKGDDARLKLARGADGAVTATFEATSFDIRGLIQAGRRSGGGGEPGERTGDWILKLRAARIVGFDDLTLTDVSFDATHRNGFFQTLSAAARAPGGRSLSAVIKPEADHRRLTVSSDDAGSTLRFLDVFDRIRGGRLTLTARLDAAGTAEGVARIQDFRLLEEPPGGHLAAVRESSDGTRQIPVRRVEIDKSTDFDRASVRFTLRDGVVNVAEAIAKGASVGATAAGQVDLNNQRLSLQGTYIPAYGLNNLAGRIPILGAIAGAGSEGGLVGVTFRVVGAIDDPILQINPLSAVAPGIFRRIFEFQQDETPAAKGDPNAPTKITP